MRGVVDLANAGFEDGAVFEEKPMKVQMANFKHGNHREIRARQHGRIDA